MSEESPDGEPSEITERTRLPLNLIIIAISAGAAMVTFTVGTLNRIQALEAEVQARGVRIAHLEMRVDALDIARGETKTAIAVLSAEMVHVRQTGEDVLRAVRDLQRNPRAVPR